MALPAASVPPTTVATHQPERRDAAAAARNITGTVVSSSSSMIAGLGQPDVRAERRRATEAAASASLAAGRRAGAAGRRTSRHLRVDATRSLNASTAGQTGLLDEQLDRQSIAARRRAGRRSGRDAGQAGHIGSRLARGRAGTHRSGAADRHPVRQRSHRRKDPDRDPRAATANARLDRADDHAVDTVRVLAMDAVQKVGNGHPGTAMSLAPAAYLLFQKVMRHNPADPHWPGRDRFVLSCGHSSLTLYIQLYLAGYGLELDDLKSLRTWGSKTPGHPEFGHTAGVETTTGPLGQGVGNAVGMAMAARRERGLFDPDAGRGRDPRSTTTSTPSRSDGDLEEGVSSRGVVDRRAPAARQPRP